MKDTYVNEVSNPKFKLQDNQYEFPYHYIPYFDNTGVGIRYRLLKSGFEYLCYVKHVLEIVSTISPKTFLEVGCGDGRVIGYANNIEEKVGVDLSHRAISFAKAFHNDLTLYVKDASELDKEFDVVVAVEVLEHIPDEQINEFFKILADRTKTGGTVIITVPSKVKQIIKKHYRHYDTKLFHNQLKSSGASLKVTSVEYIYRESLLVILYKKIFNNKLWDMNIKILEKVMWNYIWKNLRYGDEINGMHLVVTLQKSNPNV